MSTSAGPMRCHGSSHYSHVGDATCECGNLRISSFTMRPMPCRQRYFVADLNMMDVPVPDPDHVVQNFLNRMDPGVEYRLLTPVVTLTGMRFVWEWTA